MSGAQTPVENPVQYRVFQNAVVNNSGPFFNILSKTKIGKIYDPGRHQSQVLQILHELAHMVFKNGSPLIPGDVDPNNSSDKSEENTEQVLKHCKGLCCKNSLSAIIAPSRSLRLSRQVSS